MTTEIPNYLPGLISEWAGNAITALPDDLVDELKVQSKATITLRLAFICLPDGQVVCKAVRRLGHAPDVAETVLSTQRPLPMGGAK